MEGLCYSNIMLIFISLPEYHQARAAEVVFSQYVTDAAYTGVNMLAQEY